MQDDVMRDLLRACEGVLGSDGNFEKQLTALSTTEVDNVVENFGRALRYILARAAKRSDLEPLFQARDRREDMALAGLSKVEESPESAPVSSVAPSVGLSFIKEWKAAAGGESFRAGPVEGSVKMLVSPVRQAIAPPGAHRDDPVCNVLVSTKAAVRPPEEGAESPGTKFRSIQHFLQAGAPSNSSKYGTSSFMAKSFRRTASDGKTPVADAFQTVKMALTSLSNSSALDEWSIQKFFESTSSAYSMEAAKLPDLPDVLPEPTSYERATCLFFDICEFTMTCARKSSTEVGLWLLKIHDVVERHMRKNKVQVVEIRGDCYICVTGTNHVEGDEPSSQVSRIMAFGSAVQHELVQELDTQVRIGVAMGGLTIGYIRANSSSVNVCAYGDTVNTAARMEANGRQGRVLMTQSAGLELQREKAAAGSAGWAGLEVPVVVKQIKSKGLFPTVWYDCASESFVREEEAEQSSPLPFGRLHSFPKSHKTADITVAELVAHVPPPHT